MMRSYMICTVPRSGSTMLCKLLEATGIAGRPNSHFHVPSLDRWLEDYGLVGADFSSQREALYAVFEAAIARGKNGSDVFGLRMQRASFSYFMDQLAILHPGDLTDAERIEAALGPTLFVHLSREDRLGQAISRLRAEQTGLWHLHADGTELERQRPQRADGYDRAAILAHMRMHMQLDAAWKAWFERERIAHLTVSYKALTANPHAVLADILSALGLDASVAQNVAPQTTKLADETSRRWRARFEAETGRPT
ncbi:MAG: Stf0 family sulfotransferase [Pseudomonadota bacterium]